MRSIHLGTLLLIMLAVVAGCSDSTKPAIHAERTPPPAASADPTPDGLAGLDLGAIHNQVMYGLHERFPYPCEKASDDDLAAASKALLLARFPKLAENAYDEIVAKTVAHRRAGLLDPAPMLTDHDRAWWNGLAAACRGAASPTEVRRRLEKHGAVHGLPLPGTTLWYGVDVLLASSEFWFEVAGDSGEKLNLHRMLDDAAGAAIGAEIGWALARVTGRIEFVAYGAAIGAVAGSSGYFSS